MAIQNYTVTTTPQQLFSTNPSRDGATLTNTGTATLYVGLGATPAIGTASVPVAPGGYYEVPFGAKYSVYGVCASSTTVTATEIL